MNEKTAIQNELLALLSQNANTMRIEKITPSMWDEIITLAGKQHVDCYLYYQLKQSNLTRHIPVSLNEKLSAKFMRHTMRNLSLIAQMREISRVLHLQNISVIALKGLQIAQTLYPHIATRYLRDMDLLIPLNRAKEAYEAIRYLGYESEKEPNELDFIFKYHKHLPQQYHPQKKTMIELHGYIESTQGSFDELSDGAFHADKTDDASALFLSTEELLIHLCVHISYGDLFKIDLRHYLDIYLLLSQYGDSIAWDKILEKADVRDRTIGVLAVLSIVSYLFGWKIPPMITEAIADEVSIDSLTSSAIEFLWFYDKSSAGYDDYKAKTAGIIKNESLFSLFFKRLLLSREELAFKYGLELNSPRIYFYYPIRLWDMIRDNTQLTLKNRLDLNAKDFAHKTRQVHIHLFGED